MLMTTDRLNARFRSPNHVALALVLQIHCFVAVGIAPGEARENNLSISENATAVLEAKCLRCHGGAREKAGLNLSTRDGLLQGGDAGPAIVPGQAVDSLLYQVIAHTAEPHMPLNADKLPVETIALIERWINDGAKYPGTLSAGVSTDEDVPPVHWAYAPLEETAVPAVTRADWVRTPIDAFVLKQLESRNMQPSPKADKRTLLRRVYFDLIGLPPTLEALDAFLTDESPDAYDKVVDQLLASSRYGERWARHWMDVAHFAETHGHDQDRPRPNAWPYRDYLIESFNADKPYARFVEEQLAGDVLYPGDPQGIVALGFIAGGPWDESSQVNIVDDTVDKKVARYLDRDDMVSTTMSTFVSATVHCARCHHHKFDPISQAEYFGLQAVFAGVDRADRPYDPDPEINRRRQELLKQRTALDTEREPYTREMLLGAAMQSTVEQWEQAAAPRVVIWTPLDPMIMTSAEGAQLSRQPDRSVLSQGDTPEVDTYTITAHTELENITAIRLEVLTDDRLPYKGPGRQQNGNFHLSEFGLYANSATRPATGTAVGWQHATADFEQAGWTAAMAIDDDMSTAWGIYPHIGDAHAAVFAVDQPIGFAGGTYLTFTLDQLHGRQHLIGRFRLSVTTTPPPVRPDALPEPIVNIIRTPTNERSETQTLELTKYYLTEQLARKIDALPEPQWVYAAASDFTPVQNFKPPQLPRSVDVLRRGDVNTPIKPAEPMSLSCIPGLDASLDLDDELEEGQRRAALARWITDERNVLTWRSIVNRVWHYHFGRGIVDTPNDFGAMGSSPTHPDLLDWLAIWFRERGSMKQLHRLIVTSSVYRQSAQHVPDYALTDADNHSLWRMNRKRLDAESVRDAILQISGKIDLTMGGPSVKQFVHSKGIHITPIVDNTSFDLDDPANYRRSIYRFLFRTLPDPLMDVLDCPDASQLAPKRSTSVTALHALAMLNNQFVVRQSEHFARRVSAMRSDVEGRIDIAYELAMGRPANGVERAALADYARQHGMANTCRLILNLNEFMFVH